MFEALRPQSLDPIMATFARFTADSRPSKINLAVGMCTTTRQAAFRSSTSFAKLESA